LQQFLRGEEEVIFVLEEVDLVADQREDVIEEEFGQA
jgi:hypothetical protein